MKIDTVTLSDLVRRLTIGTMTQEHNPQAVAKVINDLCQERDSATARIRELETICLPSVQIAERNGYAKGFRAGAMAAAQMERDPMTADAIAALQPNYALAGESI